MKKTIFILMLALVVASHAQDNAVTKPKYVNWGVSVGPSVTSFAMQLPASFTEPLKVQPGLGLELGGYMDYNLSSLCTMQFSAMTGCERVHLLNGTANDVLMPHTIDIAIKFGLRLPLGSSKLLISAGPYSQFVYACPTYGTNNLENPFTRQINNEGDMALNDFHSGAAASLGVEVKDGWQLMLNYGIGLTNILNVRSSDSYVLPQKLGLTIGRRF